MKAAKLFLLMLMATQAVAVAQVAPASTRETPLSAATVFVASDALPWQDEAQARTPAPMPPPGEPRPSPDLGKWWKDSEIVKDLQLTSQQITQIEQTFLEHRLKLIDLRADVERQEAKLQPLIEADQPDEAKVSAQLDQLLAARSRLDKANAMMMLSIRKVLTVEQWKKLEAIKEQRERFLRMRMPPEAPEPPGARPPSPDAYVPAPNPLAGPPDAVRP